MAHKSKGKTLYAINILLVKKRALREKEATTDTNPLYTSYSALSKYWGHLIGNSSSNSNKVCYTAAYIFFSNLLLLPIEKRGLQQNTYL